MGGRIFSTSSAEDGYLDPDGCEAELRRLGASHPYVRRLITVPGIAWILAPRGGNTFYGDDSNADTLIIPRGYGAASQPLQILPAFWHLCPGLNLVGYPLATELPVTTVLAAIAGKFSRVYGFNAAKPNDPWEIFDVSVPDFANTLQTMKPGRGYYILATQDTTLTLTASAPSVSRPCRSTSRTPSGSS